MLDLAGKVAVVTGGASGIGLGIAERCLTERMRVVLADIEEPALMAAAGELASLGEVIAVSTDVSSAESVDALGARAQAWGPVSLVFNNAGVGGASGEPVWRLTLPEWRWVLEVNLWGVIHGLRVFLPGMVQRDEGHIVNTASIGGLLPFPFAAPYAASKHAIVGITLSVQQELALTGSHVGVSVLCPGFIKTNVMTSSRNWLSRLGAVPEQSDEPVASQLDALIGAMVETGMAPSEVADQVMSAIREGRFWVLPNAAPFAAQIQDVGASAVELRNPPLTPMPAPA